MKRLVSQFLVLLMLVSSTCVYAATPQIGAVSTATKKIIYKNNAPNMQYAFILDGPSDKNAEVLKYFKEAIVKSTAPDFRAIFSEKLIFTGDWTEKGIRDICNKALSSEAAIVISLGYRSSEYLNTLNNKKKFVMTIDQYGLRDFGDNIFNPAAQSGKGIKLFQKLTGFKKAAVLVNEYYYTLGKDWDKYLKERLTNADFVMISVGKDYTKALEKISKDCDAVVFTPLFNISESDRIALINAVNARKLPSYSTTGKDDVDAGILMGTGALDVDRRLAEATSFSIKNALNGDVKKSDKIQFYEEELLYFNKDTAEDIGYEPHIRILDNAQIISHRKPPMYTLSAVFDALENQNLDIERKKLLLKAAKSSSMSAILKYLPTFSLTLGFQQYNEDYADSAKLSIPEETGVFKMGFDQMIYSPALVTNILIKKKKVDFSEAEKFLTEQSMGLELALLYINTLTLENLVNVQKEYVKESRENLAIARVREKMGFCGKEEVLRWASQLSVNEQNLINMRAEYKNLKIQINKILFQDAKTDFAFAPLTAADPAFYTKDFHVIDYVCTPKSLAKFTDLFVEESYKVSPELAKLRAAIKMKDYELGMYVQKFFLPDAKLSLEYTNLMNPSYTGDIKLLQPVGAGGAHVPVALGHPDDTNWKLGVFAKWTPFEGGTKFAEISRIKAERAELERYADEVKTSIDAHVRETINRAVAAYFSIEKHYKAMYTANESYLTMKDLYLNNKITMAQLLDSQKIYLDSKAHALNSQYDFFKELLWVQRGICAVNWSKASPEAKEFILGLKEKLGEHKDINISL